MSDQPASITEDCPEFTPPADLSPDALFQLAKDVVAGKVFTNAHVRSSADLPMVFMPLCFGVFAGLSEEQIATVGMVYEYLDKAGPLAVNGMPTFFSMNLLSTTDVPRLFEKCEEIQRAIDGVGPAKEDR